MTPLIAEDTFTMPLTLQAHQIANRFRLQQPTPQKAKQVYLNTLAVQAVDTYLNWLGIETDLAAGDCWNPAMQALTDTADLVVKGQGRLECRFVLPTESRFQVPPEVMSDRIGYVVVQFDLALSEATLLGFLPAVGSADVALHQLRSLNVLLEQLTPATSVQPSGAPVHLGQWLQDMVEASWQTLDSLLGGQQPTWNFRSMATTPEPIMTRGKLLDLTSVDPNNPLALLIGLMPAQTSVAQTSVLDIWVQVCPTNGLVHLPPDLEVLVLDDAGVAVMQAQSRQTEMIQLKFKGTVGETFSIKVALGGSSVTEVFMI